MASFQNITTNLSVSFNLKHFLKVKEEQQKGLALIREKKALEIDIINNLKIIDEKINQLSSNSNQIIQLLEELNSIQATIKNALDKKDFNSQNFWAKKHGFKSAIQYTAYLNKKKEGNLEKIEQEKKQLEKYNQDKVQYEIKRSQYCKELELCQKELVIQESKLKNTEEALLFYKSIRNITICHSICSILLFLSFLFANISMDKDVVKILCGAIVFVILLLTVLGFIFDFILSKNLHMKSPNILIHCFSLLISASLFLIMFDNVVCDWVSMAIYAFSVFMAIYNMFSIVNISNKDENFYLPIDFLYFNLPILTIMGIYIMFFSNVSNALNYVADSFFSLMTVMFFVTYLWIFKEQKPRSKIDFKYCILTILNIMIFFALILLILLIVLHLIQTVYIPTEVLIFIITSLCTITSPIFKSLFKPTVQDPLKGSGANIDDKK